MKILITGDLVIDRPYSIDNISPELIKLFQSSDYNIVNLEAPVTNSTSKIIKTGPHLKSDRNSTLEVLKGLNINLCTLANNHVLDYDEQGVLDTIDFCRENGIQTVGAGKSKYEATKVLYLGTDVGKIAIINIAENEWASATDTTAGANGMDLIDDVKRIQEAKEQSEFVFVIVHGGHEYYNLPSPRMQKQYRFYIDNGADIIVGHHTHCISGMEIYENKPIYYSLGNFLFTKSSVYKDWYKGMILEVKITSSNEIITTPIFVKQQQDSFELSLLKAKELNEVEQRFKNYCQIIKNELDTAWIKFILIKEKMYLSRWSANVFLSNKYLNFIFTKLGIILSSKKGRATLLNLMRCESHADVSRAILNKKMTK